MMERRTQQGSVVSDSAMTTNGDPGIEVPGVPDLDLGEESFTRDDFEAAMRKVSRRKPSDAGAKEES